MRRGACAAARARCERRRHNRPASRAISSRWARVTTGGLSPAEVRGSIVTLGNRQGRTPAVMSLHLSSASQGGVTRRSLATIHFPPLPSISAHCLTARQASCRIIPWYPRRCSGALRSIGGTRAGGWAGSCLWTLCAGLICSPLRLLLPHSSCTQLTTMHSVSTGTSISRRFLNGAPTSFFRWRL